MLKVALINIAEDFRKSLIEGIMDSPNFTLVDAYGSVKSAMWHITDAVEIALIEANEQYPQVLDAISDIKFKYPECHVVVLTDSIKEEFIIYAILHGANGYLLKQQSVDEIISALEAISDGGTPLSPTVATKILDLFNKYIPRESERTPLSVREMEILQLLIDGRSNREIAEDLFISIETVRNHIKHIYEKLKVHSKSQAVLKAIKLGIYHP